MNLLLDSALKATMILLAAWLAARALRGSSADVRHTIWLVAMLAVAMLPAFLSIPSDAIPSAARFIVRASVATTPLVVTRKLPWLFVIWAVGVGVVLARLILGIAIASRITRSARTLDGALYSERAATPMTWGFFRPVVILPMYATAWTPAERDLVIRHERAHIARHDWFWQMLGSAITAVFWFHPLMWLANIQLRREAEAAVDDRVLADGVSPSDYAERLVDVARRLRGYTLASVLPMVRKPELETRVRSILDTTRSRASVGVFARCMTILIAAVLIFPIAMTRQKVYAMQEDVYKIGKGVSQPTIIYKEDPGYTDEAQADGIQGTVRLQGEISKDGRAENLRVVKSLDPGLDANAIIAVSNWRFRPGMKDGEPVRVYATIEVTFHLK